MPQTDRVMTVKEHHRKARAEIRTRTPDGDNARFDHANNGRRAA